MAVPSSAQAQRKGLLLCGGLELGKLEAGYVHTPKLSICPATSWARACADTLRGALVRTRPEFGGS